MSGNSGGGIGPSINRPSDNENCNDIVINTNLASPKTEVLEMLTIGNILTVQAASDQGPIQAFNENGELAGNIVSREMIRLLSCIAGGTIFEAEVTNLNHGQCSVQIRAVG